jgi:hypothetical protein
MAGIELPLWLVLLPGQLRTHLLEFFAVLSFLRLQFLDALQGMIRERSGGSGPAVLTNPINIGIGTK